MGTDDPGLVRASSNLLLGRLSHAAQLQLEPFAERVTLACGTIVMRAGETLDAIFFPETAIVSLGEQVGASDLVEVAVVGREGMLGWPALLGSDRTSNKAVVELHAGTALRIGLAPLRRVCDRDPSSTTAIFRFVHTIIMQMTCSIASLLRDTLDMRLARWLLMRHDRMGGDVLVVRHDQIASSLNVRRASVTDQLHVLEGERLIRCTRGKVLIRDRCALEAFAGAAYGSPEAQYRRLIAPFGKSRGVAEC